MSNYTFILIADRLLARVDLRVRNNVEIESFATMRRPEHASQTSLLQSAIGLIPKPCDKAWLFSTDLWTGSITIPSDLHSIANNDELHQSALLEAELQSEISAFHSKVAITRIADDNHGDPHYWVAQIKDDDLVAIEQIFSDAKIAWQGIAHPSSTCPSSDNPVEEDVESIVNDAWNDESTIESWAIATAREVATIASTRPCFVQPTKTMSEATQNKWAALIGALTIAACIVMYARDVYLMQQYEASAKLILKQKEADENLVQSVADAEAKRKTTLNRLQQEQSRFVSLTHELERFEFHRSVQSSHCSNLIQAIAESADEGCWLQRIQSNSDRTTLQGVMLTEASAHLFASGLDRHSSLTGYAVSPAETRALENGLFEFSIHIDCACGTIDRSQTGSTVQ